MSNSMYRDRLDLMDMKKKNVLNVNALSCFVTQVMTASQRIFLALTILMVSYWMSLNLEAQTASPQAFHFQENDRIALVGDTFLEREQTWGMLETRLTTRYPHHRLVFRNFAWSGDNAAGQSRASFDWSKSRDTWQDFILRELESFQPTVVMIGYGMASSLEGMSALSQFRADMNRLLDRIQEDLKQKDPVRVILFSPVRHEAMGGDLPAPTDHNRVLKSYTSTIAAIAKQRGVPFVDLFHGLGDGHADAYKRSFTDNGIHPNAYGYSRIADHFQAVMQC